MTVTTPTNWLEGDNPFNLGRPPDWWLKRLYDFDHMLVMFPSHARRQYLLARRRQHTAGLGDVAMVGNTHPDTTFCWRHGVLPINMPIKPTGPNPWTEETIAFVLKALKSRDTWAYTGGSTDSDKVERLLNRVDDTQAQAEQKQNRSIWEDFYYRGRDAWRSMQARIGSRNRRASDYHGVAKVRDLRRVTPTSGGSTTP